MPTVITGTDGINQVQAGAVESGDLPAGSVLQVVTNSLNTGNFIASTSFVSVGFSASITPLSTSSKILIFASSNARLDSDTSGEPKDLELGVFRNGSLVQEVLYTNARDLQGFDFNASFCYEDSPNSTSNVTYDVRVRGPERGGIRFPNAFAPAPFAQLTLMEIAG